MSVCWRVGWGVMHVWVGMMVKEADEGGRGVLL